MLIIKSGQKFIHKLKNGEGMMYEVNDNLINPLKLIKTLPPPEVEKLKNN